MQALATRIKYVLLLLIVNASLPVFACENPKNCRDNEYVENNSWEFGVAIGAGVRTNPLSGGDDIPLVLIPDIAWYGDNAYFDNGELGYQWIQSNDFALETFIEINRERAFFSFWHPENIFVNSNFIESSFPASPQDDRQNIISSTPITVENVAKRRWAVDAGIRAHKYFDHTEFNVALFYDVSGTYDGGHLEANYYYRWQIPKWAFSVNTRVTWKSESLIDYYYGVSLMDTNSFDLLYSGESTVNVGLYAKASRTINENWQWLIMASTEWLGDGMTDSPIVVESEINTVFVGLAYRF